MISILSDVPMFIIPCYIVYIVVHEIFGYSKNSNNFTSGKWIKLIGCNGIAITIFVSVLIQTSIQTYEFGVAIKDTTFDPFVKDMVFFFIEFIWQMIGVALMFLLYKYIYNRQLISVSLRERMSEKGVDLIIVGVIIIIIVAISIIAIFNVSIGIPPIK